MLRWTICLEGIRSENQKRQHSCRREVVGDAVLTQEVRRCHRYRPICEGRDGNLRYAEEIDRGLSVKTKR